MTIRFHSVARVLLILYGLALVSLAVVSVYGGVGGVVAVVIFVGTQLAFIFGAGTINLCKPVRRHRLILPVLVASAMMTLLLGGVMLALLELTKLDSNDSMVFVFFVVVALSWVGWGALFFIHGLRLGRFAVLRRLTLFILGGSLLSFLITVPSYLVTSRRGVCLAGLTTAIGIAAGLCAMFWAFGPGIALLVLAERRERESRQRPGNGSAPASGES